jgi:ribosome-binding protein aMBF1 (putative translation factor)
MTKTPKGSDRRLVAANEDAADAALAKRAIARNEETLSEAEMDELLAARTPLAFWRNKRSLTQTDLAKAAKIAQGFLSEIESGLKTGDVTVLQRIAIALEISLLELVPDLPSGKRKSGDGSRTVRRRK